MQLLYELALPLSYMKNYLKYLFILLTVFTLGCTPTIDPDFDGVYTQTKMQERQRLNQTYKLLQNMKAFDAALHLNKTDFRALIDKTFSNFQKHFTSLDAAGFSKASFGSLSFASLRRFGCRSSHPCLNALLQRMFWCSAYVDGVSFAHASGTRLVAVLVIWAISWRVSHVTANPAPPRVLLIGRVMRAVLPL